MREKNVVEFYVLTNKLKYVIRKGWINWSVKKDRVESVAEHVYGVISLAIAMYSEYEYDIDIKKVIYMLAVHELEEIIIGDLTSFEISSEEKEKIGHEAVEKILSNLLKKDEIKALVYEFDERKTKEAMFAYHCDKLECDIQCKLYDEDNCVDPNNVTNSYEKSAIDKVKNGEATWSELWIEHDRPLFKDDENFISILDYIKKNKLL